MPLNDKGKEILASMKKEYGGKKGLAVFYGSRNKRKFKEVETLGTYKASKRKKE